MKELAIIGGGIHGSLLFVNIPQEIRKHTVIIDTHNAPLARFISQCRSVGVSYLRSPGSHSIHRDFRSLFRYARNNGFGSSHFLGRYLTPSLAVFTSHARDLLQQCNVRNHWIQGYVNRMLYEGDAWHIEYQKHQRQMTETLSARRVILAMGQDDANIPSAFTNSLNSTHHVLHESFIEPNPQTRVCVIGGGMSGTQCALRLVKKQQHEIRLLLPYPHAVTHFDSNPCFIGPRCLPSFLNLKSYEERAAMLKKHRYQGSINPAVFKEYKEIQENSKLSKRFSTCYGRVIAVRKIEKNAVESSGTYETEYEITLSNGNQYTCDAVICANGLRTMHSTEATTSIAPHQKLIQSLIHNYNLPHLAGNFPIVSPQLQWHSNLFVSGALAEFEIGIAARNIIGAHLAYRRLKNIWNSILS